MEMEKALQNINLRMSYIGKYLPNKVKRYT